MRKEALRLGLLALSFASCAPADASPPRPQSSANITEYVFTECKTKDGKSGYDVTVISPDGKTKGTVCKTFSPSK